MNLDTSYMGMTLSSPVVVSACTLSNSADRIAAMEDAGAGAVVLFSVFEEQIRREQALYDTVVESTTGAFAEAGNYFPQVDDFRVGTAEYLELIRSAKARVDMPVIASLNGISPEGWISFASQMAEAGADGIELNVFYIPADIDLEGREVEMRYMEIIRLVKSAVDVPVAIKLNPYFSAMGNFASQAAFAGADALVLFNRFYQPDLDIEQLRVLSDLSYSESSEIRLPLLWISALHGRTPASLAATSGVEGATEVIKYLLAGADVAMTASSLYRHGIEHLGTITADLKAWMARHEFDAVSQFRGVLSQRNVPDPSAYERANYVQILESAK
jgi:dihydroorotate dehydrogenase (fumarate)